MDQVRFWEAMRTVGWGVRGDAGCWWCDVGVVVADVGLGVGVGVLEIGGVGVLVVLVVEVEEEDEEVVVVVETGPDTIGVTWEIS